MTPIKVMLVEDDPFWQTHLADDLSHISDIEVVCTAANKEECLHAVQTFDIDVILMDINLTANHLDGLDAAQEIWQMPNPAKIIMLTSLQEAEVIVKSFQCGAANFINKSSLGDVVQAIRDAHANKSSIHPDAASSLIHEIQLMALTPMERQVYELKKQGMNKIEIAQALQKSFNTVKTQLKSIRNKLSIR
ncbi:response regulator transcription factor [Paenibacillus mendelii]|uniref:Response regulator n=1 Tax=Paenibacillus mendelii TaxID=206163 RepID=A0ABV6JGZ7_9BACL|nr:response regulator transcription factor [Paenibacillus mendelii]MCQ6557597.1 response regulator transcription factor [Paenibacillus mendelii]